MAFGRILWSKKKTPHAKFEANQFKFRGGTEALKPNTALR